MSTTDRLEILTGESEDVQELSDIAERIAGDTAPGKTNAALINNIRDVPLILNKVVEELNNWVEFIDVRVYRDGHIGIPCRYRWTIKRWAKNDMDGWMYSKGWEPVGHLRADSRDHESNELEARYRKEIDGYMVNVNIYVEFTEDVFQKMQDEVGMKKAKKRRHRKDTAKTIRQRKMED